MPTGHRPHRDRDKRAQDTKPAASPAPSAKPAPHNWEPYAGPDGEETSDNPESW